MNSKKLFLFAGVAVLAGFGSYLYATSPTVRAALSGVIYFSSPINMNLNTITNLPSPINNNEAATKGWVLSAGSGAPGTWSCTGRSTDGSCTSLPGGACAATAVVYCQGSEKAINGGCIDTTGGTPGGTYIGGVPLAGLASGWTCTTLYGPGNHSVSVYATCCQ